MFDFLQRLGLKKDTAALRGAPAIRRQKQYAAESGYVYQYFYLGLRDGNRGIEYVFEVSAHRRAGIPVSVYLSENALRPWEQDHGRELSAAERYGLVKMALFQAFDARPGPDAMDTPVEVTAGDVDAIAETLDL